MFEKHKNKITLIITVLFLVFLNLLFVKSIQSNDTWFHLRIGQEILENKRVPTNDYHSFTSYGAYYINQNWLSQLIFFVVFNYSSYFGLQIMHSLIIFFTFFFLFKITRKTDINSTLLALVLIIPLAMAHDEIRPLIYTWFFSALSVFFISRKKYYLIPPLFAIWANIHAGFILGLGALFFYLIIEFQKTKSKTLILIFLLSFFATFINPSTYKIYLYPLTINNSIKAMEISEWKPFGIDTIHFWLYFIYVSSLIIFSFLDKKQPKNIIKLIFIISFSIFGFTSMRQPIVVCILLYPLFIEIIKPIIYKFKYKSFIPLFAFLVLIFLFFSEKVYQRPSRGFSIDRYTFPVYGLEFINKYQINGKIFNDYDFGGFLLWFYPQQKIFGDGRLEIYQGQPIKDYIIAARAYKGWDQVLDKYKIDTIFIRPTLSLNEPLVNNSNWDLVYFDDSSVIYVRKNTFLNIPRLKSITPYFNRNQDKDIDFNINEYKYLLKENPNYANGYKVLAFLYLQKQDIISAKINLQQYINLRPQSKNDDEIFQIKNFLGIK